MFQPADCLQELGTASVINVPETPETETTTWSVPLTTSQSPGLMTMSSATSVTPEDSTAVEQKKAKKSLREMLHIPKIPTSKKGGNAPTILTPETPTSAIADRYPAGASALNTALVAAVEQQHREESDNTQHHSYFFRRVVWAKADKDCFYRIIKVMKHSNQYLEVVTALKATPEPNQMAIVSEPSPPWLEKARAIQEPLKRLHESMRRMNEKADKHDPWYLSVQLKTDFAETKRDVLADLYDLGLREESCYFGLQRHSQKPDGTASFLLAETPTVSSPGKPIPQHQTGGDVSAWGLDQAKGCVNLSRVCGFTRWGTVWTETRPKDLHWLFLAEAQISQQAGTLADLLKDQETQSKMTPRQRTQLAFLIAISYVHFSQVRPSCEELQLSSFRFYHDLPNGDVWDIDDPLILKPYLGSFGKKKQFPVSFGARSGVSRSQNEPIVGLGLILYQVGCCTVLEYKQGPAGLREAQILVSNNIHQLDIDVSSRYTEIVQRCLQCAPTTEDSFIEGVVSELFSLQDELPVDTHLLGT
jgi:hypothetical protein